MKKPGCEKKTSYIWGTQRCSVWQCRESEGGGEKVVAGALSPGQVTE